MLLPALASVDPAEFDNKVLHELVVLPRGTEFLEDITKSREQ